MNCNLRSKKDGTRLKTRNNDRKRTNNVIIQSLASLVLELPSFARTLPCVRLKQDRPRQLQLSARCGRRFRSVVLVETDDPKTSKMNHESIMQCNYQCRVQGFQNHCHIFSILSKIRYDCCK